MGCQADKENHLLSMAYHSKAYTSKSELDLHIFLKGKVGL